MQINTSKNILLIIALLIVPLILSAQVGRKKYITRSGDTTVIVMAGSTGLYGEDAAFLLDSRATLDYLDRHSRYKILKEAVQETDQVASIVEIEKKETNPSSGSLGFRIAQKNIRYLQNDKDAQGIARETINTDATLDELTYLYEKYGGMPSYFINGVPVSQSTAASLSEKDILTRSLKVANTSTGNPNGEVWYVVTSRVYDRLALDPNAVIEQSFASSERPNLYPAKEAEVNKYPETIAPIVKSSGLTPEQQQGLTEQQKRVDELQRQIQQLQRQQTQGQAPVANYNNRVPSRSQEDEIVSFKDSPQEKTRRARDREDSNVYGGVQVRGNESREQVIKVAPEEDDSSFIDSTITQETPKRSIRRIKNRQRNR